MNEAVNDAVTRMIGIVGLGGIALIHALQAPEAFEETAYLGALFIGAIVASLVLSAVLTRTSDQRVWAATGGLAGAIMLGYVLTRTSGLPRRHPRCRELDRAARPGIAGRRGPRPLRDRRSPGFARSRVGACDRASSSRARIRVACLEHERHIVTIAVEGSN